MKKLKIGFIQMRCEKGAIAQNMEVMEKYISKCHENNVDIVCFPEMNITGYNDPNRYADAVLRMKRQNGLVLEKLYLFLRVWELRLVYQSVQT